MPMAYLCPASIPTIGYGHTRGVKLGTNITKEEAEAFLLSDIEEMEALVLSVLKIAVKDTELSALVSFTFNEGIGRLTSSTLLSKLNEGDITGAADEFLRWNKSGGKVLPGLDTRRKAERELFLS